ncbi:MAG: flagellar basal body-associated FliL family protein [Burkholderiaceae bacterium]
MSDKAIEAAVAAPKSKKLVLILVVLALVLAGAAGWLYISKQRAAALDGDEEEVASVTKTSEAPTYLPLDNMVVNLADPGGEKVAQIGITLELSDAHATERVKQYMPAIRSSVLMLVSQRTSEELLQRQGKEKLAADILREAARPFGGLDDDAADEVEKADDTGARKAPSRPRAKKRPKSHGDQPVKRVLFSSFIVQ